VHRELPREKAVRQEARAAEHHDTRGALHLLGDEPDERRHTFERRLRLVAQRRERIDEVERARGREEPHRRREAPGHEAQERPLRRHEDRGQHRKDVAILFVRMQLDHREAQRDEEQQRAPGGVAAPRPRGDEQAGADRQDHGQGQDARELERIEEQVREEGQAFVAVLSELAQGAELHHRPIQEPQGEGQPGTERHLAGQPEASAVLARRERGGHDQSRDQGQPVVVFRQEGGGAQQAGEQREPARPPGDGEGERGERGGAGEHPERFHHHADALGPEIRRGHEERRGEQSEERSRRFFAFGFAQTLGQRVRGQDRGAEGGEAGQARGLRGDPGDEERGGEIPAVEEGPEDLQARARHELAHVARGQGTRQGRRLERVAHLVGVRRAERTDESPGHEDARGGGEQREQHRRRAARHEAGRVTSSR
jgi:hypothetical protein